MTQPPGRRRQVLEMLRRSPRARTVSELARHLQVHGNTIRFHLESLLADGLIEIDDEPPSNRRVGRPAVRYRAVPRVAPSQVRHTESLVKLFLDDLAAADDGRQRALDLGERWGQAQAAKTAGPKEASNGVHRDVNALTGLLGDMGFESDPPSNSQILVKTCPFLDAVDVRRLRESGGELPPVCAVHLGMMNGALKQWEADVSVEALVPFARPDRCHIGLSHLP